LILVTGPSALDRLHKKTRRVAERNLAGDEHVVTVLKGRSKQAMVVTDRQILIIKGGSMAGVGFRTKVTSFSFASIAAIHVHTGPGIAALEVVVVDSERARKPNLAGAYQKRNWLPCHPPMGDSPLIAELRAFVRSDGRSQSARAALSEP
jgi:hypothetical protein